ncbi:MAG: TIGR03000 domain-containing protein [Pirellulaceae bacterium]|nr:TIGR03000 domain-containing protein [Pirellulaceae bacterium]
MWKLNGKATSSTGSFRQYISPSLSQGGAYTYEVRVEATRVGQVVGQTQTVQLRAGETQNLAFNLDQPRAVETSLTLQVPQDAIVVLAGEATTATGAVRTYKTKTLTSGQAWPDYSIEVSVVRNGQLVTQEKTIRLIGGRQESLRFSFGDQQVAAR